MGKKAKEHRKKVQKRNAELQVKHKKLMGELQEQFNEQMKQRAEAAAMRAKSVRALPQHVAHGSTGDFIAQNYEDIFKKGGQAAAQKILDSDDGPKFG